MLIRHLLLILLLIAAPARAENALAPFASRGFDDIRRGVDALAVSADPRAAVILGALQTGRLMVVPGGALFIKGDSGALIKAETGEPATAPGPLKPVRVNNSVRRSVNAALGSLRLFSKNADARRTAAEAVFKARDPAARPALERALAHEADSGVRQAMEGARAASILSSPDASEADKLSAIATIRARGDLDARSLLASLSGQPSAVAAAAAKGVAAIGTRCSFGTLRRAHSTG